ncbi:Cof-type HAD-IIB family hydrolase [Lacticaseibacillus absianus]|uniref:Cof-type HAD-IIB family hydrolase n=1 Tax=Lacticaseibacillus absianus TaxID=2729623 RepID=UPI0015CE2A40|nr:Cof-type HAD-IIB family hydrolase [Lacticaseibacillus absianus]
MIQLIAIDIDDTLLTRHATISPKTLAALQRAIARGTKVVLCSGRPLAGVSRYLEQLGLSGDDQYVITNGGAVSETVSGRLLARAALTPADYLHVTAFARTKGLHHNVVDAESAIITADRTVDYYVLQQAMENHAPVLVRDPTEMGPTFAPVKAVFVGAPAVLDAKLDAIRTEFAHLYVVRTGPQFVELMHPDVSKGAALAALCAQLDLPPAAVAAIGDEENDLTMFAFAGTTIAMGNALPRVQAAADFTTADHDHDGIAVALRRLALD